MLIIYVVAFIWLNILEFTSCQPESFANQPLENPVGYEYKPPSNQNPSQSTGVKNGMVGNDRLFRSPTNKFLLIKGERTESASAAVDDNIVDKLFDKLVQMGQLVNVRPSKFQQQQQQMTVGQQNAPGDNNLANLMNFPIYRSPQPPLSPMTTFRRLKPQKMMNYGIVENNPFRNPFDYDVDSNHDNEDNYRDNDANKDMKNGPIFSSDLIFNGNSAKNTPNMPMMMNDGFEKYPDENKDKSRNNNAKFIKPIEFTKILSGHDNPFSDMEYQTASKVYHTRV